VKTKKNAKLDTVGGFDQGIFLFLCKGVVQGRTETRHLQSTTMRKLEKGKKVESSSKLARFARSPPNTPEHHVGRHDDSPLHPLGVLVC